jgi:hypothetical protein
VSGEIPNSPRPAGATVPPHIGKSVVSILRIRNLLLRVFRIRIYIKLAASHDVGQVSTDFSCQLAVTNEQRCRLPPEPSLHRRD